MGKVIATKAGCGGGHEKVREMKGYGAPVPNTRRNRDRASDPPIDRAQKEVIQAQQLLKKGTENFTPALVPAVVKSRLIMWTPLAFRSCSGETVVLRHSMYTL